jgi:hypothetical protein
MIPVRFWACRGFHNSSAAAKSMAAALNQTKAQSPIALII